MKCDAGFVLEDDTEVHVAHDVPEPSKFDDESPYSVTINTLRLTAVDRVTLALGIASSHYPSILKTFVQIEESSNAFAIEAGGEYNKVSRSFKPTFQTALFLLAGKDLSLWSHYSSQLINGSVLLQNDIIYNRSSTEFIHGKIELDTAYLNYFLSGQKPQLDHGSYFPGKLYRSDLTMDDIILEENVREQIKPIGYYIKALENGFSRPVITVLNQALWLYSMGLREPEKQCWQEFLPIRTVSICTM
ncbi:hypothetical protein EJ377_17145 [Chryseobacterium arthrosphaerae]|uniref:Uncharacterized protein n=1 Tax=Chryseobacterium arthrosphaerae TaxID=651561 RepID=A0A3S0QFF0_9FLAO|nr:hypothetical protein EJ377_17145 [Chryseobacterium arthrosphaerae]